MNSLKPTRFEDFLHSELMKRRAKIPRYSLRQFAQDLKLEPSYLSKILNRKRRITLTLIERLGKKLRLSSDEIQQFMMQLMQTVVDRPRSSKTGVTRFKKIEFSSAVNLAGWLDFAILELSTIQGVRVTAEKTAQLFDIPRDEAQMTLSRLEGMKLLRYEGDHYVALEKNHALEANPYTTAELKRTQRQYLEKAIESLEKDPLESRDHTGMTMALRADKMPEAKKMIKKFRRGFMRLMEKEQPSDRIYQLTICLFPLSQDFRANGK